MRILWTLALCGTLALPLRAQDAAPKADAKAKAKVDPQAAAKANLEKVNAGELRLDGKITAILGEGVWQMEANSWTSPRGVSIDFEEPKTKSVLVSGPANIHPRGEVERVPLREVKLSSRVAIIGKNRADGTLVAREVVLLEGYGSHKTVGSVATNPFTSALVDQSREARAAGQLPKALSLIEKAISTAKGLSDASGEGLATQDKALLHIDMEQPKEAFAAFGRVESLGRTTGNSLLLSLGLSGEGKLYLASGQNEKAIAALKEGDTVSATSEPAIHLGIVSNLAMTYLLAGQLQNGIATLNRVHPLEDAGGKEADAGETLLLIAALNAPEKTAAARQTLQDVQPRIEHARDEKAKAGLVGTAALVRWRLGEKEAARSGFTEAAGLLNAAGASKDAKRWEGMSARLEGAAEGWQPFFLAASGIARGDTKPENEAKAEEGDAAPPGDPTTVE
ncbi:hypothetical protein B1R32_107131 [Abditibacterium utsteinense]|uniref:Tetratricopeptide repeat-containing protein n=1 Tax=Abditibacterium utsteinense TaxID=1960156 RepID=A0A2S8STJ5_9BACT|nr:hypothetical protein [Abditibacterium utsteinense]PQV64106.1 hypothetical protein B1R32_107131 [Abditibacterium utsteinense]